VARYVASSCFLPLKLCFENDCTQPHSVGKQCVECKLVKMSDELNRSPQEQNLPSSGGVVQNFH